MNWFARALAKASGVHRRSNKRPFDERRSSAVSERDAAAIFDRTLEFVVAPFHDSMTWGDRLLTLDKAAAFRDDPRFIAAMAATSKETGATQYASPDGIAWRLNTLIWAARRGVKLKGDFVECGVYKGDMSWVVTEMVDLAEAGRAFYLYDTFGGFAPAYSSLADFPTRPEFFAKADAAYSVDDLFDLVQERFAAKPYVKLIKGTVPDILHTVAPDRIAFLHIDMNSPGPEVGALEYLFDRIVPGAAIIFDDYGWVIHRRQKEAADKFMAGRGQEIFELPTGQGLTIRQ